MYCTDASYVYHILRNVNRNDYYGYRNCSGTTHSSGWKKDNLMSIKLFPSNVLALLVYINVVYLHAIRFALRLLPSFASCIKNDNMSYLKETFEM